MIVTGDDPEERKAPQEQLAREFEMKDLGELKCQDQRKVFFCHNGNMP